MGVSGQSEQVNEKKITNTKNNNTEMQEDRKTGRQVILKAT